MSSQWSIRTALLVVFAVSVSLIPMVPSSAAAVPAEGDSVEVETPPEPVDAGVELAEAARSGERVEVVSARTEDSTTFANPDGTLTVEIHTGPIRVDVDGEWVDIDPTLVSDENGVHPVKSTADLFFSAGGSGELVGIAKDEARLGFTLDGVELPVPVLEGNLATYKEILPGVDLVLEALPHGYAKRFIVNERPKEDLVLRLPVSLTGLELEKAEDGTLKLTDDQDRLVALGEPPMMWGDTRDEATDEPTHQMPVDYSLVETAEVWSSSSARTFRSFRIRMSYCRSWSTLRRI